MCSVSNDYTYKMEVKEMYQEPLRKHFDVLDQSMIPFFSIAQILIEAC